MFGKKDDAGQVSETSQMTPGAGVDGTPGTEDGTPLAADTQHAPHEGPKDYAGSDQHLHVDEQDAPGDGHENHHHDHVRHDGATGSQTLVDTTEGDEHHAHRIEGETVREGETFRPETH